MQRARLAVVTSAGVLFVCLGSAGAGPRRIEVTTTAELLAAVNDPANERATVRLAPGTYVIQVPLRLQPGMSLVGSEKRADADGDGVPDLVGPAPYQYALPGTETVIDGTGLPSVVAVRQDCAGMQSNRREPMIHLGAGNSIADLTVLAGSGVGLGEPALLVDPDEPLDAAITSTVVASSGVAVSFANSGCAARGARSKLTFTGNVLPGAANGLVLENNLTGDASDSTADGPTLEADVSFSRFVGGGNGIVARPAALGTDGARLVLRSVGNVFSGNRGNIFALGAFSGVGTQPLVGNHLEISSRFDVFGATPVPSPAPTTPGGGVFISGGSGAATAGPPLGNTVDATIHHARFVRDLATTQAEIAFYGSQRGNDNHVEVKLQHTSVRSSAGARASGRLVIQNEVVPGSPPSTVRLIGSSRSFAAQNPDFDAPPAAFFAGGTTH